LFCLQDRDIVVDFILEESLQSASAENQDATVASLTDIQLNLAWFQPPKTNHRLFLSSSMTVLTEMLQCCRRPDWLRHPVIATLIAVRWRHLRRYFYSAFCWHLLFSTTLSLLVLFDQAHHRTFKVPKNEEPAPVLAPAVPQLAPGEHTAYEDHTTGEFVLLAISLLLAIPVGLQTVAGAISWATRAYRATATGRQGWPDLPGKENVRSNIYI
jgi:hypothetical protein